MNVFRCIFYTKSFQIVSGPCAFISQMMSLCRVFTYEYMYVHWLYVYIDNTMHLCIWKVNCVHSVIYIYIDISIWMCVWWFMIRAVVCVYQNATFMWSLFIDAEPVDRKYFNMFFFHKCPQVKKPDINEMLLYKIYIFVNITILHASFSDHMGWGIQTSSMRENIFAFYAIKFFFVSCALSCIYMHKYQLLSTQIMLAGFLKPQM